MGEWRPMCYDVGAFARARTPPWSSQGLKFASFFAREAGEPLRTDAERKQIAVEKPRHRAGFAGPLVALVLTACAAEPPYYGPKPLEGTAGYTDLQLDRNRFRVTYSGNSATGRETVENFLLLRAAQVTLQAGYADFLFDTRDTKAKTTYFSSFTGFPGWGGYGWYWHSWPDAFAGPPFDGAAESLPITRFEAYAEIVLLTPPEAAKEPRAIDASQIVARIGPLIQPPSPPKP
jgi:hypothetical protein